MTEKPEADRAVTVAELLARHGQVSGTAGRAHRRRAREGGISVAELTGEIPIIRDHPAATQADEPEQARKVVQDEAAPDESGGEQVAASTDPSDTVSVESAEAVEVATTEDADDDEEPSAEEPSAEEPSAEEPSAEDAATDEDAVDQSSAAESAAADTTEASTAGLGEHPKAYSAYDAVADAGPQSPREFASTTGVPAMAPLAGSIMTADAEGRESTAAEVAASETAQPDVGETAEPATAEPATAEAAEAGLDPEAGPDSEAGLDAASESVETKGPLRQWAGLAAQAVVGVVVGAALFVGFERLWDTLPYVALVLAILAILAMVAVVRILRKTDDIASVLIAVVVGVIVTIGPLAFVLSTS